MAMGRQAHIRTFSLQRPWSGKFDGFIENLDGEAWAIAVLC
jgi:hypothetical protein